MPAQMVLPGCLEAGRPACMVTLRSSMRTQPLAFNRLAVRQQRALHTKAVAMVEEASVSVSSLDEELDQAAMYSRFDSLISGFEFAHKSGDRVVGTVVRVDQKGAYVDVGAKGLAYCPGTEVSMCKIDKVTNYLEPDTRREFSIIKQDGDTGELTLSLKQQELALTWQRIRQMQEEDVTLHGKVESMNRGGVMVAVCNLRGFVPTSHITQQYQTEEVVGQDIPLKFLEVDEERQRLVLSNKRAVSDSQMAGFAVGDVVVGLVTSVKPYGAFVDIGGVNGLLHISQISHDRITNVETIVSSGDKLKVMVLSYDKDRGRVALSTKKLEPTPGDMLRNPALVYERAEEMAEEFKKRVAAAEAAARAKGEEFAATAAAELV